MTEYIDRDKLIEGRVSNDPVRISAICEPAADVVPVMHGRWKPSPLYPHVNAWNCSACNEEWNFTSETLDAGYCHSCGAKMDGKERYKEELVEYVPVVRCQECIHWMAEGGAGHKSLGTYRCPCARWSNDDGYTAYTDPDDFCSYGEAKEEEQNDE